VLENVVNFEKKSNEYRSVIGAKLTSKLARTLIPAIITGLEETLLAGERNNFANEWRKFIHLNLFSSLLSTNYASELLNRLEPGGQLLMSLVSHAVPVKADMMKLIKPPSATANQTRLFDSLIANYSVFNGKYHEIVWKMYDSFLHTPSLQSEASSNLNEILSDKMASLIDVASPFFLASYTKCSRGFVSLLCDKVNSPHNFKQASI
jgi:hypothetical protein